MKFRVLTLIFSVLTFSAFAQNTIWDYIEASGSHLIFSAALFDAGLKDTLKSEGPLTVFAPTDNAFLLLPDELLEEIFEGPKDLQADVMFYHVLSGKVTSTDLTDGKKITMLNGDKVEIKINAAGTFVNQAKITVTNIQRSNGIIHIIDALLIPPFTVWDRIAFSKEHTILEEAVKAAGLVNELNGEGPLTVFAPTDTAFAALPPEMIAELLADPQGALTDILRYHVAGAKLLSGNLSNGQKIATLGGGEIDVSISSEGVFVDNAKVIVPDVQASNGVLHIIDNVLLATVDTRGLTYEPMEVRLFPNPAAESFILDWQGRLDAPVRLRLINTSGQPVRTWTNGQPGQAYPIQDLPDGVYFLEVIAGRKRAVKALAVE